MGLAFPFPFLDVLTLPTDATTGQRIILDGVNGKILVYNTANSLFAFVDPALGIGAVDGDQYARLTVIGGIPVLLLDTGDPDEDSTPNMSGLVFGAGGTRNLRVTVNSGNFSGQNSSRMFLYSESHDGTEESVVVLSTSDIQLATAGGAGTPVPSNSLPRGIVDQESLTTNNAHSVDGVTDLNLTNVPVVAGRTYEVHLHTQFDLSAAGTWHLVFRVNGSTVDRFATINEGAAKVDTIDATVYWTPSASGSTDDLDVFADEVAGAATLTLQGAAGISRTLTLTDVGVL